VAVVRSLCRSGVGGGDRPRDTSSRTSHASPTVCGPEGLRLAGCVSSLWTMGRARPLAPPHRGETEGWGRRRRVPCLAEAWRGARWTGRLISSPSRAARSGGHQPKLATCRARPPDPRATPASAARSAPHTRCGASLTEVSGPVRRPRRRPRSRLGGRSLPLACSSHCRALGRWDGVVVTLRAAPRCGAAQGPTVSPVRVPRRSPSAAVDRAEAWSELRRDGNASWRQSYRCFGACCLRAEAQRRPAHSGLCQSWTSPLDQRGHAPPRRTLRARRRLPLPCAPRTRRSWAGSAPARGDPAKPAGPAPCSPGSRRSGRCAFVRGWRRGLRRSWLGAPASSGTVRGPPAEAGVASSDRIVLVRQFTEPEPGSPRERGIATLWEIGSSSGPFSP
jgi:hypothetical protein